MATGWPAFPVLGTFEPKVCLDPRVFMVLLHRLKFEPEQTQKPFFMTVGYSTDSVFLLEYVV